MNVIAKELMGVPAPKFDESPASWLTRAASSQGTSPKVLARYLGLRPREDPDLQFTRAAISRIAGVCGLRPREFYTAGLIFGRVRGLDRTGSAWLLSDDDMPIYHFCPCCLHDQRERYFPLHWRFKAWSWCPAHLCAMAKACPHCAAPVRLPGELAHAGPKKAGVASLGRCLKCARRLDVRHEEFWGSCDPRLLSSLEATLVSNGRALLALLYRGKGWLEPAIGSSAGLAPIYPKSMLRLRRLGLLPTAKFLPRRTNVLETAATASNGAELGTLAA